MDQSALHIQNLIGGILTPQQDIHQQAQDQYFHLFETNPSQVFLSLGTILQHSDNRTARLFAAVILRQQSMPNKKTIDNIDPAVIVQLKAIAMHLFQTEPSEEMRRKVIEFASVFASRLFLAHQATPNPADAWPEILQLTCQGASLSDQPAIQASCFDMLTHMAEYCVQVFAGQDEMLTQLLSAALTPTTLIDVAISAATASLSLLISNCMLHTEATQPHVELNQARVGALQNSIATFTKSIPSICQVFVRALSEQRENKLSHFIAFLDQTIHLNPNAFASSFNDFVAFIISVTKHPDLEPGFRQTCLTLLIRFGNNPAGRALCRKHPSYQQGLLSLGFEFLHDVEFTQQWAADPLYVSRDEDEWPNFHLGLYILRSLPSTLGVKAFLTPMLQEVLKRAGDNSTWKQPHAALNVLMLLAEDHLKSFPKPAITAIRTMLIQLTNPKYTSKANPRVTVACLQAIHEFSSKIGQNAGKDIMSNVLAMLPSDAAVLAQLPGTMVFYSCRALCVLVALLTKENLLPFMPRVLSSISALLSHSLSSVNNSALVAVSSTALQLGPDFAQFAASIIPALCNILQQSTQEIQQTLAAGAYKHDTNVQNRLEAKHKTANKTIETLGFIAEALGHDLFLPYSAQVLGLASIAQDVETQYPSPAMQCIFDAFTKFADCLGSDFGPYLAKIIPGILTAAAARDFCYRFDLDADMNMSVQDQLKSAELAERGFISQSVTLHGAGSQRIAINTTVIQDKIQSLEILGNFAISLKEAFAPFLQQTTQILFPECTTDQNPRIRKAAVATIPSILECFSHQPGVSQSDLIQLFRQCITALDLTHWVRKELPEHLSNLLLSASACLDSMHLAGVQSIPQDILQIYCEAFQVGWTICLERRLAIEQEVLTGDEEEMELRSESMAIENEALDALVALNTELLATNRDAYFPFFASVVEPFFAAGIGPENQHQIDGKLVKRDPSLHTCSLVGYSDSIAKAGPLGVPLIHKLFPVFMRDALDVDDHDLRRGAAYGITACHRALPMVDFAPFVNAAIETLAKSATIEYNASPDHYDEDLDESSAYAQDNAFGGLVDIMTRFGCGFLTPSCAHSAQEQENFAAIQDLLQPQFMAQYMDLVIHNSPRYHDETEAMHINHSIAQWLQKCPQSVYGPTNLNLPHVARIVGHLIDLDEEYEIVSQQDLEIFKDTWRHIRSSLPPEILKQVVALVDKDFIPMLQFE